MMSTRRQWDSHRSRRSGWLRAVVLGANDGIDSIASLLVGVTAANASQDNILLTGVAALVAGAMSMAAGEYVSVHSQADTENADLSHEQTEQEIDPAGERRELAAIYVARGLEPGLAKQVAEQLMKRDALGAHARDELGLSESARARPIQAALASAAGFAVGSALPLSVAAMMPTRGLMLWIFGMSIASLATLGAVAAKVGGASVLIGAWRVSFWGAIAMAITAAVGALFGTVVQ